MRYIQDLKNNEASNIEKWTLEKLLMDQAMNDLQVQLDDARRENERFRLMLGSEATKPAGAEGAAQPQAPPPAPGAEGSKHEGSNGYREQGYDQQGRPYAEGSYNGQHRNSPYHHSADYTHESHAYDSQTGRPIEQPVVDPSLERERPEGVAQPVDPAVGAGGEKRGREEPETPVGPGAQAQGQAQIAEGENEADREAKRARIA